MQAGRSLGFGTAICQRTRYRQTEMWQAGWHRSIGGYKQTKGG